MTTKYAEDHVQVMKWEGGKGSYPNHTLNAVFHIKDIIQKCSDCGSKSNQYVYQFNEERLGSRSGKENLAIVCPGFSEHYESHVDLILKIQNSTRREHPRDYLASLKKDIDDIRKWFEENVESYVESGKDCEKKFEEVKRWARQLGGQFSPKEIKATLERLAEEPSIPSYRPRTIEQMVLTPYQYF